MCVADVSRTNACRYMNFEFFISDFEDPSIRERSDNVYVVGMFSIIPHRSVKALALACFIAIIMSFASYVTSWDLFQVGDISWNSKVSSKNFQEKIWLIQCLSKNAYSIQTLICQEICKIIQGDTMFSVWKSNGLHRMVHYRRCKKIFTVSIQAPLTEVSNRAPNSWAGLWWDPDSAQDSQFPVWVLEV